MRGERGRVQPAGGHARDGQLGRKLDGGRDGGARDDAACSGPKLALCAASDGEDDRIVARGAWHRHEDSVHSTARHRLNRGGRVALAQAYERRSEHTPAASRRLEHTLRRFETELALSSTTPSARA